MRSCFPNPAFRARLALLFALLLTMGLAAAPATALYSRRARVAGGPRATGRAGDLTLEVFDANPQFTAGAFLPAPRPAGPTVRYLATPEWTARSRPVDRVAADGASLLLLRARVPLRQLGQIQFRVNGPLALGDPGGLWTINDQRLVAATKFGGIIDDLPPGASTLNVRPIVVGQERFAFALYRAPRNFDSGKGPTANSFERPVDLSAASLGPRAPGTRGVGGDPALVPVHVVRPLLAFLHGTFSSTDTWADFPLYKGSANELHDYQFMLGGPPFQATRVSFRWIWNSTGGVQENAMTVLAQMQTALADWRQRTGIAGTQADVITHSFGGFIARQITQTQPDRNFLTVDDPRNFRAGSNWGHGIFHKLITFAGSHRGSEIANVSAYLNEKGNTPGGARKLGCQFGQFIDKGAARDQMVLSQALRALEQSRVPGHAIVGSGRAVLDPSGFYQLAEFGIAALDNSKGPYLAAFVMPPCPYDFQANYIFNLDVNTPPVTTMGCPPTCVVDPNYDLVISAYSSQARMPDSATTTEHDLDPSGGLIGYLNHSGLINPSFSSQAIVQTTANRVQFLLMQPTTSSFFAFFPATMAEPPTPLEDTFTQQFDPAWLETGMDCPNPTVAGTCPAYTSIQVWPPQMTLTDGFPVAPLVYGELNGQFVTAWSPSGNADTSRNCPITMVSSDPGVVQVVENAVIGQQALQPVGFGQANVTITVDGFPPVDLPVNVAGNLIGAQMVTDGGPPTFNHARSQPVRFALLSGPGFAAAGLDGNSVRVNGIVPIPFGDGSRIRFADVNGDGFLDAVLRIAPASLGLFPGPQFLDLRGQTMVDGTRVEGEAFAIVK